MDVDAVSFRVRKFPEDESVRLDHRGLINWHMAHPWSSMTCARSDLTNSKLKEVGNPATYISLAKI
jgi:hypothetical protein